MTQKRRLTGEEWAQVRRRWEGAPEAGFDWLAVEVRDALDVAITRQAVADMAKRKGWAKGGAPSGPLARVAQAEQDGEQEAAHLAREVHPSAGVEPMLQSRSALAVSVAGRTVSHDTGLSPQHEQFAGLLAIGTNQSEAYRQVFPRSREWLPKTVHEKASALAAEGKVQARVQELMAGAAAANEVGVGMVLNSYLARLRADPRELSEIWVGPCRYCRGTDHLYQFTDGELRRAKAKHEERRLLRIENGKGDIGEFDEQGGGGFNITLAPCTACPNCGGAGVARSVLKDSRNYSADALALFVSAHEGKEGIKVNVNDRDAALQQIARYVGFFEADKDPAATVTFNIAEADALYERALAKSAADAAHAKGRMARLRAAGIDVDGDAVDATLIGGDDE